MSAIQKSNNVNSNALSVNSQQAAQVLENVIIKGDLSQLAPGDRVIYYKSVCESIGLNPLTRPFDYIELNGSLQLYVRKDATEQLRKINNVSITKIETKEMQGLYIVTAYVTDNNGRCDIGTGAVSLEKEDGTWETTAQGKKYFKKNGRMKRLQGDDLANAIMKAETKAKRRATLSLVGLGWLEESELETVKSAKTFSTAEVHSEEFVMPADSDGLIKANEYIPSFVSSKSFDELKKAFSIAWKECSKIAVHEERQKALDYIKVNYDQLKAPFELEMNKDFIEALGGDDDDIPQ